MKAKATISVLAAAAVIVGATTAGADVKVYNATPPGGTPGDQFRIASVACPTTLPTPGSLLGESRIADTGTGTVTLSELEINNVLETIADFTAIFGPGAFLFFDQDVTESPAPGQTGLGSTAKGTGAVSWGVLSGWSITGGTFCVTSPTTTCNNNGFLHGQTVPGFLPSPTYDLGTWSFDSQGDYEASPYIQATRLGGQSNRTYELRARFVGAGIPALPAVGIAALAGGLAIAGLRQLARRR